MNQIKITFTIALSLILSLTACAGLSSGAADTIVKSPNDTREYRAIVLDNGMPVLLVSDPDADKAAASVDINAGSNSDPAAFPGLAHFLEHMLFLGTQKFPEAGEYQQYISSHGGSHNAYTAYENTNYYFDIDKAYLEPALDRFSQFFIAPLFTPEYVDRERNAVHSEYQSGLQDDGRRGYSALKAILNPAHPLTGFSVGSLDTLQDHDGMSLRDALLAQYDRYYSANLMTAAIFGAESLDELEILARRYFADIPDRNRTAPLSEAPLFTPGSLPAMLAIEPIRDSRTLSYTFPIPDMRDYYRSKPLNYLGNLLGHEGEGSLLALLRQKGWANGLSAGGGFAYPDAATFSVNVGLTEEGVNHIDDISGLLFQFISLVREEGIHEWLFAEQRTMADLAFRFQEPGNPVSLVSGMSRRLQEYPATELITAAYTYEDFAPALIREILDELRPDNVLLTFTSRNVQGDEIDPWYGTRYRFNPIPQDTLARWQGLPTETALAITEPNPFLPEDLAIKPYTGEPVNPDIPLAEDKPQLLVDADGIRLWFKQDNVFQTPRANFYVYAMTPVFGDSLRNTLLSSFVVSLVNDKLNEFSYPANLAGSFFGLSRRSRGFTLSVRGYNDKQPELLDALLMTLSEADFAPERFDIIRTEMIRGWQNAGLQTPYVRLFQEAQALLVNPYWSEEERIAAVQDISLQDVVDFVPVMLSNLRIDALYHGNVLPEDAQMMMDIVTTYLKPSPNAPIPGYGTVVKLPADTRIVQELVIDHDDSAIVIYEQGVDDSLQTRAMVSLLANILRTPFYDTLRTEQQLGYIVNAGTLPILNVNGLVFYIESPVADPLTLETNIDAFLASYARELEAMDPAMFDDIKNGMLNNMRQPPQRLDALSGRYWSDILVQEFERDSSLEMADAIAALTLSEVVDYYNRHVANPGTGRLVARSAGRPVRQQYLAAVNESDEVVILDDGNADYLPFKETAEQYEFSN
jgi:insulysin